MAAGRGEQKTPAASASLVADLMDLAAGLIQDFGRTAIDLEGASAEGLRQQCEQWSRHLLIGAPRPGEQTTHAPAERRDLTGLRRFFSERRSQEMAFVGRSLSALQKGVWAFVSTVDDILEHGEAVDVEVKHRLDRLKQLAETGSAVEILRAEVIGAVGEIGNLAKERHRALHERAAGLASKVNELGSQLEIAKQDGATDALTKLYNRKAFDEKRAQLFKMSRLLGKPVSLLLFDLDRFKQINDTLGHAAGDAVLQQVAAQLTRHFRVRSDFVARHGGDEFAALLWETPLESARNAAQRLLSSLQSAPLRFQESPIAIATSIGLTQLRPDETETHWVERTDRALYAAKAGGRNRVEIDGDPPPQAKP